jgi:hypothetical protein
MNFLRRLASWRVVDNVMILTPHHDCRAHAIAKVNGE